MPVLHPAPVAGVGSLDVQVAVRQPRTQSALHGSRDEALLHHLPEPRSVPVFFCSFSASAALCVSGLAWSERWLGLRLSDIMSRLAWGAGYAVDETSLKDG
eukprot:2747353-Rhodomonas_salina.2